MRTRLTGNGHRAHPTNGTPASKPSTMRHAHVASAPKSAPSIPSHSGPKRWRPTRSRYATRRLGHHTRVYFAFVTTAPVELDSPATVTLHCAAFSEVAGFAADPITLDETRGRMSARLVLVDAMELAWQRAKYRGNQHPLLNADPGLVGLNTLQHWLWQRLQAPIPSQVAA